MKLENWFFSRGVYNKPLCCHGEVYGNKSFIDGRKIRTSKIIEYKENEWIKTKNSIYRLGKPNKRKGTYVSKIEDYKIVKLNSCFKDIHNIISKNTYGCELLRAIKESENEYFGNLVGGLAFFDVIIHKEDCRNLTQEELEMIDDEKMDLIEF